MNPAFLHEIQRLVVAQICTCFDTVKSSAADALAEVLASYIKEIGGAAHDAADVAGRTEVNIGDVLHALDLVGANFQTIVRNADQYEVPFAHALPLRLQIKRLPKRAPAFREVGEPAPAHIPKFLPSLPDPHTLRHTTGELAVHPARTAIEKNKDASASEDVLRSLKQSAALSAKTKRKFGEFVDSPSLGEVTESARGAYYTSTTSNGTNGRKDTAASAALDDGTTPADSVGLGLASTSNAEGTGDDEDGARKKTKSAPLGAFREQSNLSNADYETVARLIGGQMSVFEAS